MIVRKLTPVPTAYGNAVFVTVLCENKKSQMNRGRLKLHITGWLKRETDNYRGISSAYKMCAGFINQRLAVIADAFILEEQMGFWEGQANYKCVICIKTCNRETTRVKLQSGGGRIHWHNISLSGHDNNNAADSKFIYHIKFFPCQNNKYPIKLWFDFSKRIVQRQK